MTSHAALTATAAHVAPAFNATFYATAATVIPVLFLALVVQGSVYTKMLDRFARIAQGNRDKYGEAGFSLRMAWDVSWPVLMWFLAYAILASGILGEIEAVVSLDLQRPVWVGGFGRLVSMIILVLAVAYGPFDALNTATMASLGMGPTAGTPTAELAATPSKPSQPANPGTSDTGPHVT